MLGPCPETMGQGKEFTITDFATIDPRLPPLVHITLWLSVVFLPPWSRSSAYIILGIRGKVRVSS